MKCHKGGQKNAQKCHALFEWTLIKYISACQSSVSVILTLLVDLPEPLSNLVKKNSFELIPQREINMAIEIDRRKFVYNRRQKNKTSNISLLQIQRGKKINFIFRAKDIFIDLLHELHNLVSNRLTARASGQVISGRLQTLPTTTMRFWCVR